MMNFTNHHNYPSAITVSPQSFSLSLPLLDAAVNEAQNNIMAPRPLIFTSALTAIALVSQGLMNVRKPSGQVVPTSLMLLAIANSGERKSTAENIFLKPVRDFQQQQAQIYESQEQVWQAEHAIWEASRKAILKGITSPSPLTLDEKQQLLALQKKQPAKPKEFKLLYEDSTSEALFQGLHKNLPTAGLTSSEGIGLLAGRAFNDLSKMNAIWSGDPITVDRKTAKSFVLNEARLTVSIMAQESAVSDYMARRGEKSRGSGLWARFLVCHPQSTQGYRVHLKEAPSWEHCDQFAVRLTELLQQNTVLLEESTQKKQVVEFTAEAADRWHEIVNAIEVAIQPGGSFEAAGDHASKLADNIARLAALLHFFEKFDGDIALSTLNNAIEFCGSCSDDFLKLFVPPPQEQLDAGELDNWLNRFRNTENRFVRKNHILQHGPNKLRKQDRLDRALELLCCGGRISPAIINCTVYVDLTPWLQHHQSLPNMPAVNVAQFGMI